MENKNMNRLVRTILLAPLYPTLIFFFVLGLILIHIGEEKND
jgi:hypothetical protein